MKLATAPWMFALLPGWLRASRRGASRSTRPSVGDDADAADAVALLDGSGEHMPQQGLADAEALRPGIDALTGQAQHRSG